MERRILLAFVLSFIVLMIWSGLQPKSAVKSMSSLDIDKSNQANQAIIAQYPQDKEVEISKKFENNTKLEPEVILVLKTEKISANFSNKGGSLIQATVENYNAMLPVTNIFNISNLSDAIFNVESSTKNTVTYVYKKDGLSVRKKYSLEEDGYLIRAEAQIEGDESQSVEAFKLDISRLDKSEIESRDNSLFEYFVISPTQALRRENAVKFSQKDAKKQVVEDVDLAGFRNRYFALIIDPDFTSKEFSVDAIDSNSISIRLLPAASGVYAANIYYGPQKLEVLKKYNFGLERAMVFSSWGWLDALAKGIYLAMHWMYKVVPNWGVCIILISFLIYAAMYPFTMSGMSSMKRMQALQPIMNKLREQYKNNPQRLNKEIMELYKEHRVNPVGGCLPLILQMPVFVALYQVLWRSVDFKGANFLWIKDLSEPDRLFILPVNLPIIGNEFNILPLLMMVIMFFQQKLSAKNMVITDPAQETQQKMMVVVFPLMLGFIFYRFASGLSLYFTTFYLMSTLSQWKMSKATKEIK